MPDLATPAALQKILADHVGNLSRCLTGVAGYGQRILLTALDDATNYANTLGNKDTTNGRALKVQYGDQSGSPVTLATFQKSGSRIQSNDGTDYIDVSNSGVAITGAFTINSQTVGAGLRVFNVADYGFTSGANSGNNAAGNTTAMGTLMTALRAAGGGIIFFPPGIWEMNATTFSHTTAGVGLSIGVQGCGFASEVRLYGTAGPLWDFAGTGTYPWVNSWVSDLVLAPYQSMASGAVLRIQACTGFVVRDVRFPSDGSPARGAFWGIDVGASATTGLTAIPKKVHFTRIKLDVLPTSTGGAVRIYAAAGIYFNECDLSGVATSTIGLSLLPVNTSVASGDYGSIDTLVITGTLLKDHQYGIRGGTTAGRISNMQMIGGHLDYIGNGAANAVAAYFQCAASAIVENIQFIGVWVASYATTGWGFFFDDTSGTVSNVVISGAYITGCTASSIYFAGSPVGAVVQGCLVNNASTGDNVIYFAAAANFAANGNVVLGTVTGTDGLRVDNGCTNFAVTGNHALGTSTNGTAPDATRVFADNY